MQDVPLNVRDFNAIAGLIFAQLSRSFPVPEDIDKDAIAAAMGIAKDDWVKEMPSGRSFGKMLGHTISWLNAEGYMRAAGTHPSERVVLATKGLAAMSAVPLGLNRSLGAELSDAANGPSPNVSVIAEAVGGFFGGLIKSLSGG